MLLINNSVCRNYSHFFFKKFLKYIQKWKLCFADLREFQTKSYSVYKIVATLKDKSAMHFCGSCSWLKKILYNPYLMSSCVARGFQNK